MKEIKTDLEIFVTCKISPCDGVSQILLFIINNIYFCNLLIYFFTELIAVLCEAHTFVNHYL